MEALINIGNFMETNKCFDEFTGDIKKCLITL